MKADGSLKSLLQGVSQQPVRDRLPGQCTEQINMSADPVRGLSRRAGTDLVGSLGTSTALGWANIITEDGQPCLVKITSTGPQVFDYNASQFTVNVSGSMTYWSTSGRWSAGSYKENTYLANEGVKTAMGAATAAYYNIGGSANPQAIIQILGGAYGKTYSISRDGTEIVSLQTVAGDTGSDAKFVGTALIAEMLAWLLVNPDSTAKPAHFNAAVYDNNNTAPMAAGWAIARQDDIIHIRRTTSTVFSLTISDDAGNVNAKCMTDSVPDIADLPRYAPHNYAVRVAQETDPNEDLWLRFVSDTTGAASGSNFGKPGAWYECLAPDLQLGFNKATMPRVMTFDVGTQQFTVGEGAWEDRAVGTDITNPIPSFIGNGVSDVATFQSRLVFISGENLVATRSKKPLSFWIGSASTLTDQDPLDLTSQAAFATSLKWAVPHNKDLVIFSADGQFVLFGRSAVTPSNAALVLTTSFEADLTAKPTPAGRNVFFGTKYGRFTGMREFFTEGGTDINDTRPITQHVNKYLRGSVAHLASTSNYDMLLVHTNADKQKLYPYQYIWSDSEKVQSAWSTWTFPHAVEYSFFDEELIYFVIRVGTEYILLRMSLDILDEDGVGYPVHLDARFDVASVQQAFVLPFDWLNTEDLIIVQGEACPNPGLPVRINSIAFDAGEGGYVVTMKQDLDGGDIVVGINRESEYTPTMPRVKDGSGDVISNARLMISQFLVSLYQTGRIIGQKLTPWGSGPEVRFEGYIVNNVNTVVGQPALVDDLFKMPIKAKADQCEWKIKSDGHWPMTVLDIEWEGTVNKRGKRMENRE